MEQVKFYSKEDMASGYNLSKAEKIIDSFDEQKEYNEIKKSKSVFLPRFNNQNLNIKMESKKCLYVGSSKKLLSRLAEHFTESHPKTYALHLSEWAKQIEQNITFQILEINKNDASDINNTNIPMLSYGNFGMYMMKEKAEGIYTEK